MAIKFGLLLGAGLVLFGVRADLIHRNAMLEHNTGLAEASGSDNPARWPITDVGSWEIGDPKAPVRVDEFFSLTCSHCAEFGNKSFALVNSNLIVTGKIRYVFHDFPLDELALDAAILVAALPAEKRTEFVERLLARQSEWAYSPDATQIWPLGKEAEAEGLTQTQVARALADQSVRNSIVSEANKAETLYSITGTPTFFFGAKKITGFMPYDAFLSAVEAAQQALAPAG